MASKPIYVPVLRIIIRGSCESVSYVVGLTLTPGLVMPGIRVKHRCSVHHTFVKAVQPTPMMNTRSLSATMAIQCSPEETAF